MKLWDLECSIRELEANVGSAKDYICRDLVLLRADDVLAICAQLRRARECIQECINELAYSPDKRSGSEKAAKVARHIVDFLESLAAQKVKP